MGTRTQLFRWFPLVSKKTAKRRIGYQLEIDRLEQELDTVYIKYASAREAAEMMGVCATSPDEDGI